MPDDSPYFKVKNFYIYCNHNEVTINPEEKNIILNKIYYLDTILCTHYNPSEFFKYLENLSQMYPDDILYVIYKYEYFNHKYINEYMNKLSVKNSLITDNLNG
jgi:hypothetical protein